MDLPGLWYDTFFFFYETILDPFHTRFADNFLILGSPDDIVELESIEISPDPPKPGQALEVTAKGYVKETIEVRNNPNGFEVCYRA